MYAPVLDLKRSHPSASPIPNGPSSLRVRESLTDKTIQVTDQMTEEEIKAMAEAWRKVYVDMPPVVLPREPRVNFPGWPEIIVLPLVVGVLIAWICFLVYICMPLG